MSDVALNQCTRKRVSILVSCHLVTILREEADVVALRADSDGEADLLKG
jgi:hypothetical protein